MALYYVTGLSGSGKSSVLRELRARGYHARGVDEDGFADWINRISGRADAFPGRQSHRPGDDHPDRERRQLGHRQHRIQTRRGEKLLDLQRADCRPRTGRNTHAGSS